MPLFSPDFVSIDGYPTIEPSLKLDFANARALDPRITFTRASTATYVGRDGLIKYAGEDEARFEHDPETLECLGLLTEDIVTNLVGSSEDVSNNTYWIKQNGFQYVVNSVSSPDGNQTADTIYRTAANQYLYSNINAIGTHTLSVWIKSENPNQDFVMQHFNGTDGSLGVSTFTATTEWQRYNITASPTVLGGWYPCIPSNLNENFYIWGIQLEAGSFPTSYIPTSAGSATRARDITRILGASFSEWYQHDQGTFLVDTSENVAIPSGSGYPRFFQLNDVANGNQTNTIQFIWNNGPSTVGYALWASGTIRNGFSSSPVNNEGQKVAFAYTSADDNIAVLNGSLLGDGITNAYVHPATFTVMSIGVDTNGTSMPIRTIFRRVVYYPKRLTNTQLQTLTQ